MVLRTTSSLVKRTSKIFAQCRHILVCHMAETRVVVVEESCECDVPVAKFVQPAMDKSLVRMTVRRLARKETYSTELAHRKQESDAHDSRGGFVAKRHHVVSQIFCDAFSRLLVWRSAKCQAQGVRSLLATKAAQFRMSKLVGERKVRARKRRLTVLYVKMSTRGKRATHLRTVF